MKIETISPNLMVVDVNASVAFFTQVFDFQQVAAVPEEGQHDWAMVMRDGLALMFQSVESLTKEVPAFADKPIGGTLTFYVKVVGVDAFYEKAMAAGAAVHGPITETFYGAREFYFKDPNGYVFCFAEDK